MPTSMQDQCQRWTLGTWEPTTAGMYPSCRSPTDGGSTSGLLGLVSQMPSTARPFQMLGRPDSHLRRLPLQRTSVMPGLPSLSPGLDNRLCRTPGSDEGRCLAAGAGLRARRWRSNLPADHAPLEVATLYRWHRL